MTSSAETKPDNAIYTATNNCRSCASTKLEPVLSLGDQYLCSFPIEADTTLPKAPLDLVRCHDCGLLQLGHSVSRDLMYSEYWYRSSINKTMQFALEDLVDSARDYVKKGVWLDIGANDGHLISKAPATFTKVACEPAQTFKAGLEEHAEVVPTYFSHQALSSYMTEDPTGRFNVITSAAMFYDVDNPVSFCEDIAKCLTPTGVWINQLNDSPSMLEANAFDAICHEHLCYYDVHSLADIYTKAGLRIVGITHNSVNGGSMRVFAQKNSAKNRPAADLRAYRKPTTVDCAMFAKRISKWRDLVREVIASEVMRYKPIWGYGASTKGSTLLQYLDCSQMFIGVAERNPAKYGRVMVGSWIPIVDEVTMRKAKPKFLMVLPWAFRSEFVAREAATRADGTALFFPLPNPEFVL